jgi:hypothetical protein
MISCGSHASTHTLSLSISPEQNSIVVENELGYTDVAEQLPHLIVEKQYFLWLSIDMVSNLYNKC